MRDETVDGDAGELFGDNRADLGELQARMAEERFDALLAGLHFGDTGISEGDITLIWDEEPADEEPPLEAPKPVRQITLKRIDGTRAEIDRFKKGYRVGTWAEADEALGRWSATVPEGSTQRVAYVLEVTDGTRFYGVFQMAQRNAPLRSWVIAENKLDPSYLQAT